MADTLTPGDFLRGHGLISECVQKTTLASQKSPQKCTVPVRLFPLITRLPYAVAARGAMTLRHTVSMQLKCGTVSGTRPMRRHLRCGIKSCRVDDISPRSVRVIHTALLTQSVGPQRTWRRTLNLKGCYSTPSVRDAFI